MASVSELPDGFVGSWLGGFEWAKFVGVDGFA